MEQITELIAQFTMTILVAMLGLLLQSLRQWISAKFGESGVRTAEILANNAVLAVEQIADLEGIKGQEKLAKARQWFIATSKEQGINMSEQMIDGFLESAVKSMNEGWNKSVEVRTTIPQLDNNMVNMQPTSDIVHEVEIDSYGK